MLKVLTVFGTRPEAIKMAPVVRELSCHPGKIRSVVCVTAQHRHMLDQVLDVFDIKPDYDLNIMKERQSLPQLTANVLNAFDSVVAETKPDWILVQGDTTTAMAVSLIGFYQHVKVGHVEAGLRTLNKHMPFPEEINRRIISVNADLHFAPTQSSRQALLAENIPDDFIIVTGNTVIDALYYVREIVKHNPPALPNDLMTAIKGKRLILVTGHRRESFGKVFENICYALRDVSHEYEDVCIVYPVHLNPNVQEPVNRILSGINGIYLTEPLSYAPFVWLMDQSYIILTDSGGVQEEAPSLGKPVLILREVTERPEAVLSGNAIIVGTDRKNIVSHTFDLLNNPQRYKQMALINNPFGDGNAAKLIVASLLKKENL